MGNAGLRLMFNFVYLSSHLAGKLKLLFLQFLCCNFYAILWRLIFVISRYDISDTVGSQNTTKSNVTGEFRFLPVTHQMAT